LTTFLCVSFVSVCVYVYIAVKFLSIIIRPRQYYAKDRIECLQGGQEGMSSEPRNESQIEKEGSLPCPISSPRWWGRRGGDKGRRRRRRRRRRGNPFLCFLIYFTLFSLSLSFVPWWVIRANPLKLPPTSLTYTHIHTHRHTQTHTNRHI